MSKADVMARAERWLAVDPDRETRAELSELIAAARRGDSAELVQRFRGRLSFGTAGIRGALGAGPTRMNRVLVRMVASALAVRLQREEPQPQTGDRRVRITSLAAVGFDARHKSETFARDIARTLAAHGILVKMLRRPLPTPVLAFAAKHLNAATAVMVTASHNPRSDNGLKIYWQSGAQLAAPIDSEIQSMLKSLEPLGASDLADPGDPLITEVSEDVIDAYLEAVAGLLSPDTPRSVRIAYTPLHGVGSKMFKAALQRAGFPAPAIVAEQAEPDPDFPTAAFPNPEETGVLDPLLALANETGADLAMAHDPDADRLAVAVVDDERWRLLSGDETGSLLTEHLLMHRYGATRSEAQASSPSHKRPLLINTIVSSRLMRRIAAHHNADHCQTLTGFKWIMKQALARRDTHELVLGYEEALGYAISDVVRDKDGISAAVVMAELAACQKAQRRTVSDLLNEIHRRHGMHVTGQRSIRFEATPESPSLREQAMQALRLFTPTQLGGHDISAVVDLMDGSSDLPNADVVTLNFDEIDARVTVRPSGTEPKLKVYAEAASPDDSAAARRQVAELLDSAVKRIADPERVRTSEVGRAASQPQVTSAQSDYQFDSTPSHRNCPEVQSTRTRHHHHMTHNTQSHRGHEQVHSSRVGRDRYEDLRLLVRCTDLTTLAGDDTPGRVRALCSTALRPDPSDPTVGPVAAVCVYSALAGVAAELLAGTRVEVASVAGAFPSGLAPLEIKVAEVAAAVAAGATEIDTVINRSAFLTGRHDVVVEELEAMRQASGNACFKVILEVCELGSADAIRSATQLAIDAGADMVKTSTGKGTAGASPEAVTAMAQVIAHHHARTGKAVGIKIAGGVSTAADALSYLDIVCSKLGEEWLTPSRLRFGASSLLGNLVAALAEARN